MRTNGSNSSMAHCGCQPDPQSLGLDFMATRGIIDIPETGLIFESVRLPPDSTQI